MRGGRLLVVSNRLPVTFVPNADGRIKKNSGGLVTAVLPVLRRTGGSWIGWTGTDTGESSPREFIDFPEPFALIPIPLTRAEADTHYRGFSNEVIWPLFHGFPSRCRFEPSYWDGYRSVNDKFADTVAQAADEDDFIWVHDYHLMLQARALRLRGLEQRLAYFHHIPFPSPDIFEALPWRLEILHALLQFDSIGFQTARDRNHFVSCLRRFISGLHATHIGGTAIASTAGRSSTIGVFPISVDFTGIEAEASKTSTVAAARAIRGRLGNIRLALGVDRLDYTKGIPERLIAFQTLLENNSALCGQVTLLQLVVPSRSDIPEYMELKLTIERLVGKINGQFGQPGWIPIHYFYRSVQESELISLYRAADVVLVTPLKDGMNLVSKEFCACRSDLRGVLVLSEFAGAADELKCGALLVNPNDIAETAWVIGEALAMNVFEQASRMRAMRSHIRKHDVFRWAGSFDLPGRKTDLTQDRGMSASVPAR